MKSLDLTREEAIELIESDKEVDRMTSAKQWNSDLNDEQKKVLKESTGTGTKKKTSYKFDKKKRKSDSEKADFIQKLYDFLKDSEENVEIVNTEREISLEIGENSYSLVLTKHRKPKK